ncbi:uncharacterized protein Dvar_55640 [Desulfosarcina variabilis str. Montpellier]|mgnify:CR=1 FL=1|uniref:DUF4124 domain-containing protein n=1 Tax=Desulfosarcina variabilis TaxID=2300 RepID=UPI003AFB1D33
MQTWKTALLTTTFMFLCWTMAFGEYYRYTDADGNQRFTDNLATVPAEQRPTVQTYQSVKSTPAQPAAGGQSSGNQAAGSASSQGSNTSQADTWNDRLANQANELDRMQVDLAKTYQSLQKERDALAAKAPPAWADADTREAYRKKVDQLNRKIDDYESRYAEFKEKQKAFYDKYNK